MKKNLLPERYNKGSIYEIVRVAVTLNILAGLFFATWYTLHYKANEEIKAEIATAEQKLGTMESELSDMKIKLKTDELYQEIVKKQEKKDSGKLQVQSDYSYNVFLHQVNSVIPSEVKLGSVSYINENDITITGQSTDYDYVSEFYSELVKNNILSAGELQKVEVIPTVEGGNYAIKEVVYFEIKGGDMDEEAE